MEHISERPGKNVRTAANSIVILYVIIKILFYYFVTGDGYWVYRVYAGIITIPLIIFINSWPALSKRAASVLVPFTFALVESILCAAFIDGDRLYFTFLMGTVALSYMYMDTAGLFIYFGIANLMAVLFAFVFRFPMMGLHYHIDDAVIQLFAFNIFSVVFLSINLTSSAKSKIFEDTSRTFNTITKTTPSYMVVIDGQTRVKYISDSLIRWLGLDDIKYVNDRPLLDLFASGEMKMMFQEVMESEGFVEKNFEIATGETTYWFMLRSSLMGEDKIARFFEWVDITPVMDAKNEAEMAAEAKSHFLARMSHEIRTPMNAIVGMAELILREEIPPVIYEHTLSIKHAGANLLSIINDILDFSKIESGKLEIVPSEYLFASLINDVLSIIRMRITEKPILFVANIDCDLPNRLIGDEARIRQILLNILSNAVKYTNEGFISIAVDGKLEADTVVLTFVITDSGTGIKEEDEDKLFGDFVRIDMQKNKNVEGTGLGLAISKRLCMAMDGDISVSSEYGVGSCFTVSIPQKFDTYEKFAAVENPEEKRVLIYEPRAVYANSIATSIDNLGVPYTLAANQSEFYEKLKEFSYPFVFVSSFLLESVKGMLDGLGLNTKLVLLAEFGENEASQNIRTMSMPVHAISIANVLNDIDDNISYNESSEINVRFIAPSAKILLVDDIVTNLKVAEGLMAPYEMQISTCKSGAEAIELVRANRYDVVFMDHMMPEMDGIEATDIIRGLSGEDDYYKNVPIIALTANAVSGVKEMFLQNGLNDFLAKPIETSKLNSILERWIPQDKRKKYEMKKASPVSISFEIEEVDVKAGVAMTGGTVDNYIKTLGFFYKDGLAKINEIRDCVKNDNIKLYTTYVHALKSAAASIGAAKISDFAKALENAGKNENIMFISNNTEAFLKELETLLQNINSVVLDYQTPDQKTDENDLAFLRNELIELKEALEIMDARKIDSITNNLNGKKWDKQINDILENISQSILLFDYEEASAFIVELLEQ